MQRTPRGSYQRKPMARCISVRRCRCASRSAYRYGWLQLLFQPPQDEVTNEIDLATFTAKPFVRVAKGTDASKVRRAHATQLNQPHLR
jgi:hypothetical protein